MRIFSSRTPEAKALKVLIMKVSHAYLFFANFLHIPNSYLSDDPNQSSQVIFQKKIPVFKSTYQISNFHDNMDLEKKDALT